MLEKYQKAQIENTVVAHSRDNPAAFRAGETNPFDDDERKSFYNEKRDELIADILTELKK